MVRFLERYGYPVSYTTIESIDGDPAQVRGARALMDVGHSEYWSARRRAGVRAARANAARACCSSAPTRWPGACASRAATAASSQAGEPDHGIVAYKESPRSDPDRAQPTGLFPLGGAPLVGSAYDGCITPARRRARAAGLPLLRRGRPSPGLQPRWLFAGTGITRRDEHPRDRRLRARPAHARRRRRARCWWARAAACRAWARTSPRRSTARVARDDALQGALGGARVRAPGRSAGSTPLARAAGLARRAAGARPAGRGDDAQRARARCA